MAALCINPAVGVAVRKPHVPGRARGGDTFNSRRTAAAPVRCSGGVDIDVEGSNNNNSASLGRRDVIFHAAALVSMGNFLTLGDAAQAAALSSPQDGPVLVVGATGNTGRRVVAQLLAKGVAVRAGSRDVKKAQVREIITEGERATEQHLEHIVYIIFPSFTPKVQVWGACSATATRDIPVC